MRDKNKMKYEATTYEKGFDTSEHDEWNTYANEDLEEGRYSFHIWNESSEEME